jgi:hypothetical protein
MMRQIRLCAAPCAVLVIAAVLSAGCNAESASGGTDSKGGARLKRFEDGKAKPSPKG